MLDYVLGEHAGVYLLGSSLLVITLATIAAIIDMPLRALQEASLAPGLSRTRLLPPEVFLFLGVPSALVAFASAAVQAYISTMTPTGSAYSTLLHLLISSAFVIAVGLWAFSSPLNKHWGLGLAGFGLGLAVFFPLLAAVLHLNFEAFGLLSSVSERLIFAGAVGGIVCSVAACVASMLSMMLYVVRGSLQLASQHKQWRLDSRLGHPTLFSQKGPALTASARRPSSDPLRNRGSETAGAAPEPARER